MMRNPYEEAFKNYPVMQHRAPRMYYPARHYVKPERYNASQDINDTTRVVVAGAVTIGALGLLGGMFGR